MKKHLIILATIAFSTAANAAAPVQEVPFSHVQITDSFWAPRIDTNRRVSIPSAFHQCEINGRFDNFALAAGIIEGEHKGDFPFDDTDPYKIIEGASYSLAVHYDAALDAYVDSIVGLIAAAQEPDGYLTTCVTNRCERLKAWWGDGRWQKINSHELYNSGHLIEAAVAHYTATGKRSLLDVAIRNADLICRDFGDADGQKHMPSGHPIIEMALAKLYRCTGDKKYLDQALYFVQETGRGTDGHRLSAYSQDHKPILEQDEIMGHAVRAGYLYSGVAEVAALTGDAAWFDAIERIWTSMAARKLYLTGGIGSRGLGEGFGPDYELHNHTAYAETCAAIANVYWNHRMFLATGDARYIDVVEQALYNGVISGVSLSGDKFFYDNPLESGGEHERRQWFGCACCPGNITRFVASVPGYMYGRRGDDVFVNLYAAGTAEISDKLSLRQATRYPYDGKVDITIDGADGSDEYAILVRIPGWARNEILPCGLYSFADGINAPFTISLNGKTINPAIDKGYAVLRHKWRAGDRISLDFPMEVRRVEARREVVDDRGKLAITRGPIVYCLEGIDQADNMVFNKIVAPDAKFTAVYEPDTLGGIVALTAPAMLKSTDGQLTPTVVRAVPYSTWNNRGAGEMAVWIPMEASRARALPAPTIASKAKMYAERKNTGASAAEATSNHMWASGYNDQWEPLASNDTSRPYHYWWDGYGPEQNICYGFDEPVKVSSVDVYWLDFDHYDGNCRVPAAWTLSYKDAAGQWQPVDAKGLFTTEKDCYNHLEFTPVETTDLKISATLADGQCAGVIEWKVN